jgi:hypothetical protein
LDVGVEHRDLADEGVVGEDERSRSWSSDDRICPVAVEVQGGGRGELERDATGERVVAKVDGGTRPDGAPPRRRSCEAAGTRSG